jgi:predicted nucleic acid-binding protein
MKAVFDTNILIDYLNGIEAASKELSLYQTRLISVVSYIEVLAGAYEPEEENIIRGFLSSFEVAGLSTEIAEMTIQLRRDYRLRIPDAMVYATARVEGCMLVSRNTKDFKVEWPDVRVPYTV